jgi:hypothetical protein
LTHRSIAAWSRSAARRTGRCTLHPIRWRSSAHTQAEDVTDASVHHFVHDAVEIEHPDRISVGPRNRCRVTLKVTAHEVPPGSFTDALLLVQGVASIVVRVIVKAPAERTTDA